MSVVSTFNFDTAASFVLSNTAISGGKGKLAIVPNPAQVFTQDFSSDVGFTYDAAKAEFTGGLVRQKDQRPTNSVLGITYTSSVNLSWATFSTLTGTIVGSPVLSGGKLQCRGYLNNSVNYTDAAIGASGNIGAVKFRYTPNYSGTPTSNINLIEFTNPSNNNGRMAVFHSVSGGTLRLTAYTSVGTVKYSAVAFGAAWVPVAGTEYEIELNWDTIAGNVRLFVDGVLQGSMTVSSYARGTDATRLHIGAGLLYGVANGDFNDVVLYTTVQHTAGYTTGYTVPETSYAASSVVLPAFSYTGLGTIQSIQSATSTDVSAPKYTAGSKYWNGSAWVASDGTYAQANSLATLTANLPTLAVSGTTFAAGVAFTDSNTQSSVDLFTFTYTGQKYTASGTIETSTGLSVQALLAFAATITTPANTALGFILKVDGALKFWNGTAWVASNGTSAESNTAAVINTNAAALVLGANSSLKIQILLTTTSNIATPEVDEMIVTTDFGGLFSTPVTCLVWGYYLDIAGSPVSGASATFSLKRTTGIYKEAGSSVIEKSVVVVTDSEGYFETELIRTSQYEGGSTYKLSIAKDTTLLTSKITSASDIEFQVPDAEEKNITDILTAV